MKKISLLLAILTSAMIASYARADWHNLVAFEQKDKIGYMDYKTGEVVLPAIYKGASTLFSDGRAVVSHVDEKGKVKSGKWDIIDSSGKAVFTIAAKDHPGNFVDGYLYMANCRFDVDGNIGTLPEGCEFFFEGISNRNYRGMPHYWNESKEVEPDPAYRKDDNGLIRICKKVDGDLCYGFVDGDLNVVIPPEYHRLSDFHEGYCVYNIVLNRNKFIDMDGETEVGYLDIKNNKTKLDDYIDVDIFSDGIALAQRKGDNNKVLIDKNFEVQKVLPSLEYEYQGRTRPEYKIRPYMSEGPFRYGRQKIIAGQPYDHFLGYRNYEGEIVIPATYLNWGRATRCSFFTDYGDGEPLALVRNGKKMGYINLQNEFVIQPEYTYLSSFKNGYAFFSTSDYIWGPKARFGVIDMKGNIVIEEKLTGPGSFNDDGLAVLSDLTGLSKAKVPTVINIKGETVNIPK